MRAPRLILADEPTASLDADNSARVADLLFEASRETQASLLLISHDAGLLARASRVHRLEAGGLRIDRGASP
jgi:predicted ABC-type transport system involved in lysophospholipase L1 biosynthesis ATPase subunit